MGHWDTGFCSLWTRTCKVTTLQRTTNHVNFKTVLKFTRFVVRHSLSIRSRGTISASFAQSQQQQGHGNRAWPLPIHQPLPAPVQQPMHDSAYQPVMQSVMRPPSISVQSGLDMHVALNLHIFWVY